LFDFYKKIIMKQNMYKLLVPAFILLFGFGTNAQTITRFAGYDTTSAGGYGGDGAMATATTCKMNQPMSLAHDGSGNTYIAEGNGSRVRVVTSAGIILTLCGDGSYAYAGDGGVATASKVSGPHGLAVNGAGDLYVADMGNNRIRKIDHTTGVITTVAGNGASTYAGDGGPASAAQFQPFDVKFDAAGNMYICDWTNNRIRKINTHDTISTVVGTGVAGYLGDGGQATAAQIHFAYRSAFDAAGNMFFIDGSNNCVRKVNMTTGIISTVVGNGTSGATGDGGLATAALLASPTAVAFDIANNMYIADRGNNRIRKVNVATGIINTVCGTD
jgi:trimeric autotransporter adhesin